MKTLRNIAIVVLCAVGGFMLVRTAEAQQERRGKIVLWEYRDGANLNMSQLNTLGAEGWELVTITAYGKDYYYVLKRPR